MKIYISGPITNNPGYEKQFAEAEEKLLSQGHLVINPAKNPGTCYKDYLDIGLLELMKCDAIYLLPGWEESKGAQLEQHYADVAELTLLMKRLDEAVKDRASINKPGRVYVGYDFAATAGAGKYQIKADITRLRRELQRLSEAVME